MQSIGELNPTSIKNYPERVYSIKGLCKRAGLSPQLQRGFWMMHRCTVSHHIRDLRVIAAEHLIRTTDLNISEVVYSVGLTSRSYFTKIFKINTNVVPHTIRTACLWDISLAELKRFDWEAKKTVPNEDGFVVARSST